ncbi:MAG: quinone oxidoreductase [Pseudomonadota bacterium]
MTDPYVIRMHETGGPDVLKRESVNLQEPGPGEALVRQTAVGLNFIDTYHRTGLYPVKLPYVPGSEGAGVVEAVGEGVDHIKPGDRVGYLGAGTYASHYRGAAATMLPLPDGVSEDTAAAVTLKGLTAWMLLFEIRRAGPGDTALVWAAAGGVGSLLVPWAAALGVRVIGVVSTEEKAAAARANGASEIILAHEDVAARVRELTGGAGVDVSYDSVGKDSAEASLAALKPRGWWVSYGNASGPAPAIEPGRLAAGGSLILTRPTLFHFFAGEGAAKGAAALFGALRSGVISADIGQRFKLTEIADAHRAIESRQTRGATILEP